MKNIIILTSAYPYFPGEQFLETEIHFWAEQSAAKVILVPVRANGVPRSLPSKVTLDLTISKRYKAWRILMPAIVALFSKMFRNEVLYIWSAFGLRLRLACVFRALAITAKIVLVRNALAQVCAKLDGPITVYSYWNGEAAYASVMLKRQGLVSKVTSRAHGWDLYQERRPGGYMPLKRQFVSGMDDILAISNSGKSYLQEVYLVMPNQVRVSRLGVEIPEMLASTSEKNRLNIVSVAFCTQVKRIDKIIDAISLVARMLQQVRINWIHIGDGPLLSELRGQAKSKFDGTKISYEFMGLLTNSEVRQFYFDNDVDLFINASESEGVPVSIMEAMSYGIPVIAPNVGGVAEIVSDISGRLLSSSPDAHEIASAILRLIPLVKNEGFRRAARNKIITDYSAKINYRRLVNVVLE